MQFPLQARADATMGLQCQSNSHCIPMVTSARACYENCIEFSLLYENYAINNMCTIICIIFLLRKSYFILLKSFMIDIWSSCKPLTKNFCMKLEKCCRLEAYSCGKMSWSQSSGGLVILKMDFRLGTPNQAKKLFNAKLISTIWNYL